MQVEETSDERTPMTMRSHHARLLCIAVAAAGSSLAVLTPSPAFAASPSGTTGLYRNYNDTTPQSQEGSLINEAAQGRMCHFIGDYGQQTLAQYGFNTGNTTVDFYYNNDCDSSGETGPNAFVAVVQPDSTFHYLGHDAGHLMSYKLVY